MVDWNIWSSYSALIAALHTATQKVITEKGKGPGESKESADSVFEATHTEI